MLASISSSASVLRRLPSTSVTTLMTTHCPFSSNAAIHRVVGNLRRPHQHHRPHPRRRYVSSPLLSQRFTLPPAPSQGRYNLANSISTAQGGGGGGRGGRGRGGGRYPTYVYVAGGLVVAGSVSAYFQYQNYAPLTNRRRWIASTPEMEKQMGDQNYQQLLVQYRGKILPRMHPATIAVERVGSRIFRAACDFARENNLDYFDTKTVTFTVVDSEQANAFVLPGNHVFVLTGILKYARTEDELGGILGHEMAHNLARHQGEKMSSTFVVGMIARLSLLFDPSGAFLMLFMPAAEILGELPNSRTQETEADQIGMRLAAEACFDPEALGRVFLRMETAGSDRSDETLAWKPPEFLSTHPSDDSRIKHMQKWLPEDKRIFNQEEGERCRRIRREIAMGNGMMHAAFSNTGADGLPKRG